MNRRRGNKSVDPGRVCIPNGFCGLRDVSWIRSCQCTNPTIGNLFGDHLHRLRVTFARRGKTCFDDVYPQFFQLSRNTDFLRRGHRRPRTLLAVTQSRIKNVKLVVHACSPRIKTYGIA